jgi:hypothetical protein
MFIPLDCSRVFTLHADMDFLLCFLLHVSQVCFSDILLPNGLHIVASLDRTRRHYLDAIKSVVDLGALRASERPV